jgi:hypothetical protein
MIKRLQVTVIWLLLFAIIPLSLCSARATVFISGLEDLPLINGLEERLESSVIFDSPQGRVVEVIASGVMQQEIVSDFYQNTLPQLGWTKLNEDRYQREGETLSLEFIRNGSSLEVRFFVEPTAAE